MDNRVVSILRLVCFVIMATAIMHTVTATVTISDSRKPYYSSHIHLEDSFYEDHLIDSTPGGRSTSLQPHDFGLKKDERKLEEGELASSMDTRDVEALLSFRKAITSDPYGSLLNWTAENSEKVCFWTGIWCRKRTKRVVALILPGLQLEGSLSPSFGSLSLLRTFDVSHNNLSGRIPPEFGQLKALGLLDLSFNLLQGSIPTEFGRLTKLEHLQLRNNQLTGHIPAALGNCTQLTHLVLDKNGIQGSLPMSIFRLPLTYLSLSENTLSGNIPEAIANLTQLTYLNLGKNKLTGNVPKAITKLTQLIFLNLGTNNLTGSVLAAVANLNRRAISSLLQSH